MKKALIVTYYWPPAGGGFVQRVSKFCKYLPQLGWQPAVLTVDQGTYANTDASMQDETSAVDPVYRAHSWEPHSLYARITGAKHEPGNTDSGGTSKSRLSQHLHTVAEYIRLNCFIPDARIGWYPGAVRLGHKAVAEFQPDAIFSTAPPFTVHLVARALHRKSGLPWIADYRDPWAENCAYNTLPRLRPVKWINHRMEVSTYHEASRVICAAQRQMEIQSAKVSEEDQAKFRLIRNGYDLVTAPDQVAASDRFMLSYFGSIYPQRFPVRLVDALEQALTESDTFRKDFCFRLVGTVSGDIRTMLTSRLGSDAVDIVPFQPSDAVQRMLYDVQCLLLTVNKAYLNELIVPGKIYQYLATGNPMLGIGPVDGESARLTAEYEGGQFCDYEDADGIRRFMLESHARWKAGTLNNGIRDLKPLQRRTQAGELAELLNEITAPSTA